MLALSHELPAVDVDIGTGDEAGLLVGQEGHQPPDLLRGSEALHRDRFTNRLANLVGDIHDHIGGDIAWRHRIDGNALVAVSCASDMVSPCIPALAAA